MSYIARMITFPILKTSQITVYLGANYLTFEGGGLESFEKKIPAKQEKTSCSISSMSCTAF